MRLYEPREILSKSSCFSIQADIDLLHIFESQRQGVVRNVLAAEGVEVGENDAWSQEVYRL